MKGLHRIGVNLNQIAQKAHITNMVDAGWFDEVAAMLNNVSMVDGKKYYRSESDYRLMQRESDALCREYGLSVIEQPERGEAKQYAEWQAERGGNTTWRSLVKSDVDTAIRQSVTERQFFMNLHNMGYEIKAGIDISVRPPGKERFVRLQRNFGDGYAIEGIRKRILAQTMPERQYTPPPKQPPKAARMIGSFHKVGKITGYRALYFYYLYRMRAFNKKHEPDPKQAYFLFREDIRYMRAISKETQLLAKYGIDTAGQLNAHKEGLNAQIAALSVQRAQLRNMARSAGCADIDGVKEKITALSGIIGKLRRDIKLCGGIERRSARIKYKLNKAGEYEKSRTDKKLKEKSKNEQQKQRYRASR
jgi:hypothetical protein